MGFHAYQTAFTSGELAPGLFTRVDFQKYANGAERIENAVINVKGGATRRAGTMFVAHAKSTSAFQQSMVQDNTFQGGQHDSIILKDFVFNTNDAMVLEIGPGYIRFFKNREQVMGTASGSELVTNGEFTSDLSGWTTQEDNGGTVTQESPGVAQFAPGGVGASGLSQEITGLTSGEEYVLSFEIDNDELEFNVGSTLGAGDIFAETTLTPGDYRLVFTASGTSAFIQFFTSEADAVSRLDNVSMGEAVPLEIETPYAAADIRSLRFAQSADVLYITHRDYAPRKLTRLADALWTLQEVVFSPPPTEEVAITPDATLTPGATTGQNVAFTTDVAAFLNADVGRQIRSRGGLAVIITFNSTTSVQVDIIQAFLNTNPIGSGNWNMDGSPSAGMTIGARGPVNAITTATLSIAGFRATDDGAFLYVNDGIFEIINIDSSTAADVKVLKEIDPVDDLTAIAGAWTLEFDSWSESQGFPEVVSFFEQRLLFSKGQSFWASVVGDFENMGRGPEDDDSYSFQIASGQVDIIRWIKSMEFLILGTIGNEYKADGVDAAITPNNPPQTAPQSSWGSDPEPDAITAGAAIIFVQRGRRQIREMAKAFEAGVDAYQATDLAILAEHIFKGGVRQLARSSSPASFLIAVLDNGRLGVATYERPENVVAWGTFTTGPEADRHHFKSVTVIPNKCGSGDEIWALVERDSRLFVEVFDGQLNTDCALVYEDTDTPAEALVGLSHLDGYDVDVVRTSQSAFQSNAFQMNCFQPVKVKDSVDVVESGAITLDSPAVRVEVGLHYNTYIKTLRIEVPGQQGTAHFRAKRSNTIYARFLCTRGDGVYIDDENVPREDYREIRDWSKQANLGWNRDGQVLVKQTKPYPMTVLGLSYAYQIDDGDAPVGDHDNE